MNTEEQVGTLAAEERHRREVASAVHELRAPLATVRGFLETLLHRRDQLDEPTRQDIIEIALRNAIVLGDRIEKLLAYEGIARDPASLHPTATALETAVHHIVQDCAGMLADHDVVVEVAGDLWAQVDVEALAHVLGNLLSNAAKHSPVGSTITVRASTSPQGPCVQVVDQGEGIDAEDLPHVFEPFYRGRDRRHGAGLGLSVVRRYVDLWGGSVAVDSGPERGTTVAFTLAEARALGGAADDR